MAEIRKEIIDGVEVAIVEDSRNSEDGQIHDFLGQAQDIESLDKKEKDKKINEIFGSQKDSETDEDKKSKLTPRQMERNRQIEERAEASRASSDVALAMMLADKAVAESSINPCYVVHGAKMICSFGSREARLVVPLDHGTCLTKIPQMVDEDYKELENVKCFGNCFSPDNPNMEQAAIEATNQYNQEKSQTFWGKVKGFFGVKPKEVESVSEELVAACICECTPKFLQKWNDGNEKSKVDGKNTLIQTCMIVCEYGGVVKIVDNGQEQ
jgi:hypothetical protein